MVLKRLKGMVKKNHKALFWPLLTWLVLKERRRQGIRYGICISCYLLCRTKLNLSVFFPAISIYFVINCQGLRLLESNFINNTSMVFGLCLRVSYMITTVILDNSLLGIIFLIRCINFCNHLFYGSISRHCWSTRRIQKNNCTNTFRAPW